MFNPFRPVELIEVEEFRRLPDRYRTSRRTAWSDPNRQGEPVECFLEGPSFDRAGNLWFNDIPFGRIFRLPPGGDIELVAEYDGWPNGLKIHKDGRIFVTCYKHGIVEVHPDTGKVETVLGSAYSEGFKGTNDLHFAANGDLYFTDQGQTGIADPTGRVYRWGADGRLDRLAANVPSPNGITLSLDERQCYVGVTRSQQIWRLPLMADGNVSKTGVAIQLSGGHAGPDGIECDAEGGLVVCHIGVGIWRFEANFLPTHLIHAGEAHRFMTNIAFGGPDNRELYITDSVNGVILRAKTPFAGKRMFAFQT
jgi:gluconolactonase